MKYTKKELQQKNKNELIKIILNIQNNTILSNNQLDNDMPCKITIADGTQGMRRGE